MKHYITLFLALAGVCLFACNRNDVSQDDSPSAESIPAEMRDQLRKANEGSAFQPGGTAGPMLAIEIEVTNTGIRPIPETATIVYGPQQENSELSDLMVVATTESPVKIQYTIRDPRLVEIEGEEVRELPAGRTFIHLPLRADYEELFLLPIRKKMVQGFKTKPGEEDVVATKTSVGGKFDLRPVLERACGEALQLEPCREIMKRRK